MAPETPSARRSAGERAAAWLVTGPVGHLVAFGMDVGLAWLAWAGAAVRRRGARRRLATRPQSSKG